MFLKYSERMLLLIEYIVHFYNLSWIILFVELYTLLNVWNIYQKPKSFQCLFCSVNLGLSLSRLRGATVARLTPDQKAACSNHVGVKHCFWMSCESTHFHFLHSFRRFPISLKVHIFSDRFATIATVKLCPKLSWPLHNRWDTDDN